MHSEMLIIIIYSKTFTVKFSKQISSSTMPDIKYLYSCIVLTPTNDGAFPGNILSILNYNEGCIQIILIKLSSNRNYEVCLN